MNRLMALVFSVIALSACTARPSPPTTVSQGAMNLDMLQRIKDEGAGLCGHDGGLKGVTWAYNSTPNGNLTPQWLATPSPPPGAVPMYSPSVLHQRAEVSHAMNDLAAQAPKLYLYDANDDVGPENATYLCADGSEYTSVKFRLVP